MPRHTDRHISRERRIAPEPRPVLVADRPRPLQVAPPQSLLDVAVVAPVPPVPAGEALHLPEPAALPSPVAVPTAAAAATAPPTTPAQQMADFAAAPPTAKAQHAVTLADDLATAAATEQQTAMAELPVLHAQLATDAEAAAPLVVAAPDARHVQLEAATPALPSVELPLVPDPQPYTANSSVSSGIDRLLSGESDERAAQLIGRMRAVQTNDPAVLTSPGLPPRVPLADATDPARIAEQHATAATAAYAAQAEAQQGVLDGPGPEQAQPLTMDETVAIGELSPPRVSEIPISEQPQAYLAMDLPQSVRDSFDAQQDAAMRVGAAEAQALIEGAADERDRQRSEAVATAEAEATAESAAADEQQRAGVAEARTTIQQARQETLDAQYAAVADLEVEAQAQRSSDEHAIAERVATDQQQIAQRYDAAERDARHEVARGEQAAAQERSAAERTAAEESWWDRAVNAVRSALAALADAIGAIFDAVRAAVNAILDAAVAFAEALIDAAAHFISDAIAAFGALLSRLVEELLGDIFPELAAALNTLIETAVAATRELVAAIAAGLRAVVSAIASVLRAGLNAIISAFESAVQFALAAAQAALSGDWSALARMVLEAVLEVAGIDPERFYQFIGRAEETLQLIIDDPGAFVGHLVRAFLDGVDRFAGNFLSHLQAGIIAWLTGAIGGAGITLPERFDLMGVLSIIQQILGLTWDRLRERAVRLIGEQAVAAIEFVASYLQTLLEGGWSALWERIQEDLASLRDMVLDGIKDFLLERIITAAITRLITMFNPLGAIINLIITAYNLFTFLVEQARRLAALVETVVNAIGDIARGVLAPAAERVEQTLANLLPLAIDLLARVLGLGNVGEGVQRVIERVRHVVDRAIDRLIERVRGLFRGGGTEDSGTPVAGMAGELREQPFLLGSEQHTLRGRITGGRATIEMASGTWGELSQRITNIRRVYISGADGRPGLMHNTPSLARQLGERLDAIGDEALQVIRDVQAAGDEARQVVVMNAGLDRIEAMFRPLGAPPFMVETERQSEPPTHRYAPLSLDSYGRATGAIGDPISSASHGQGSPASANPPGLNILRGVGGIPQYQRGHLLAGTSAESLGGPGNDLANLVPISPATNIAMRDGPERVARTAIYDAAVHPPNMLRYTARCRYRDMAGLDAWLSSNFAAASGSAARLYALARANTEFTVASVHTALGGALHIPAATVAARLDEIRRQLAYYFLTNRIDITIESLQGPTAVAPTHPINNHQGVSLP